MKKHTITTFFYNVNAEINDADNNNNKLYWKLLKEAFHIKPSNEIPPILCISKDNDNQIIFSDFEKNNMFNDLI